MESLLLRPSQGFGGNVHLFQGSRETKGNKGTKTILGKKEHTKTNFRFFLGVGWGGGGTGEQARNKRIGITASWEDSLLYTGSSMREEYLLLYDKYLTMYGEMEFFGEFNKFHVK